MNEEQAYAQFLEELTAFALKHSITRLKISTINFDREFKLTQDGNLQLVSTKAVIRVLGHTSKVPIGEGCEFSTYEEAFEATKKYWSEYYKKIRAKRSDKERLAEQRRQKRYRERRKARETEQRRQQ